MNIYIIGHISPDLDTVASAVVYSEYLKNTKRYPDANVTPLKTGEVNKETEFVFSKFDAIIPQDISDIEITEEDRFILVDHNEVSQRAEQIPNDSILEIIDHHKININFTSPLHIDVRPLGSTCTILQRIFNESNTNPSAKAKGLILSSILSDTVGLKSPTTTGTDSTVAHELAEQLKLDIEKFSYEIFKKKSSIEGLSMKEILMKDYKKFDFGGNKVFIGVIETVEQDKIIEMKEDLLKVLNEMKAEEGLSHAFFVVQDILAVNSKVLYETQEEGKVLEEAFTSIAKDNISDIGPKLSRKKEIAPAIEKVLS